MPYNILLLPLLAGFLLISRARFLAYASSQYQKEQLLLWASLAGILLLIASRVLAMYLVKTSIGSELLSIKQTYAPFPYMGTALLTLVLAFTCIVILNLLIPESEVGLWLYHAGKFNQLESALLTSAVGVLPAGRMFFPKLLTKQLKLDFLRTQRRARNFFRIAIGKEKILKRYSCFPAADPLPVMVTLANNKVYVGLVSQLPPVITARFEYLRILPIWSGFRDFKDQRVCRTTDYKDALLRDDLDKETMIKVVPARDIVVVGQYIDGTFPIHDLAPNQNAPAKRRRRINRRASKSVETE